jgi:hypothetical protein
MCAEATNWYRHQLIVMAMAAMAAQCEKPNRIERIQRCVLAQLFQFVVSAQIFVHFFIFSWILNT